MTRNLDKMLEAITQRTNSILQVGYDRAHEKAESRYLTMISEAQKRLDSQRKYNEEINRQQYLNEKKRILKDYQRKRDEIKERYANEVIEEAKKRLLEFQITELLELIRISLNRHSKFGKPRIYCSYKDYDSLQQSLGNEYQIVADETIRAGFLLSYKNFDVDMIFDNIFKYKEDSIKHVALETLFTEGDIPWIT